MEAFFTGLQDVLTKLGASVILPIIIFVLGLILGAKPGRAFRSGVTIGIAFVGINLVIGLMWTSLSDVAQAMVERTGVTLNVVDVGWPSAAAIAFGSSVGTFVIAIALIVNIVMLATRLTKTLNIDVWNYWHFAFVGSLVVVVTGSLWLGILAAAIAAAFMLFLADWTAPGVQDYYQIPGLSIPHGTSAPFALLAIPLNWVIDHIPGLNRLEADPEKVQEKFGVFGEPVILGLVIGFVLGLLGFWNNADIQGSIIRVLTTAINLAAVMLLLPRMVQILMEGLIPISEAARDFMRRRFADREVYIGLDSAILIGHPAAISTALVLVPITVLLAVILPGNRVLPFADLAVIPFVVCMFAPITRGNIIRMIIIGTVVIALGFYVGTAMAPQFTQAAVDANFQMPENASQIISIADGFSWWPLLMMSVASLAGWIGLLLVLVVLGALLFFYLRDPHTWERIAGAPVEEVVPTPAPAK
ncbi:MAG: PTS sugar transporter subunit IIC [Anaerolineae bacterium]|nr:PTS sugar transporter subunit IIC [Anaerolineales bacterium]MCQ3976738.1 PTS sugar transporter subunit IIC [Anaerolineae bacterium]